LFSVIMLIRSSLSALQHTHVQTWSHQCTCKACTSTGFVAIKGLGLRTFIQAMPLSNYCPLWQLSVTISVQKISETVWKTVYIGLVG
jgi:hypothetical protein